MSNILKVSLQEAIKSLTERGWSHRRIAEELGVNRRTVRRYGGSEEAKCTISTLGSGPASGGRHGRSGRRSECEPLAEVIAGKLEAGLSAQRIYQDLVGEHAFGGSYQSVKRHVRRVKAKGPARVWRLECRPGEEAQVDFGLGAPIDNGRGGWRRTWVLRVVLSYSRTSD